MSERPEKHVFISYAREDRPFVDGLATRLEKAGVPVWYDRWRYAVELMRRWVAEGGYV